MRGCNAERAAAIPSGPNGREGDPGPRVGGDPLLLRFASAGNVGLRSPRATRQILLALTIVATAALVLLWMGRVPICRCGYVKLWHGVVQSSENSQHLADWYTFSHLIHGFLFYAGLWLFARISGWPMSLGSRLVVATMLEAGWEILENTDLVISRYRETTIALDYYGDSIVNSVSDMLTMMTGFLLASRLPVAATIAVALVLEVGVGYWIRDNLTLNIITLLHPFEAIRSWQIGA